MQYGAATTEMHAGLNRNRAKTNSSAQKMLLGFVAVIVLAMVLFVWTVANATGAVTHGLDTTKVLSCHTIRNPTTGQIVQEGCGP